MGPINNEMIEKINSQVEQSDSYGREDELISSALAKFPYNTDLDVVAMKIGLIDITNSTNISSYKRFISVVELAEIIVSIPYIDERIKNGNPNVVNIIAKANGKINLFSFASKYCCYHNKNLYGRDDYSIFDTILKEPCLNILMTLQKQIFNVGRNHLIINLITIILPRNWTN